MDTYVKTLGVPPGPPTQQGIYAAPEFTGDPYPSSVVAPVEENQEPPEGWPRNPIFNAPGDVPGPPVQFGLPVAPETVKPGEGFTGIGMPENDIFYFHPDHLGSTSYITTRNGSISQHVEYIAFGEVLFEEHSSSFSSPYLFNGKELDRETNLSYYGARYLDMKTSLWLTVDPLAEQGLEYSPYCYTFNNPLNLVDPDGNWPDYVDWNAAGRGFVKGVVVGVVAGAAVTALIASGGTAAPLIGYAIVAYGAYETGKTGYEIGSGKEAYTGRKLSNSERSERAGELVGGIVGGGIGAKSVKGFKGKGSTEVTITETTTKPYSKSRPSYGKNQVEIVWEGAKQKNGKVYDPNTGEELTWSKQGKREWDMGHRPGKEYRKLHKDYTDGKISKEQFLREYRNPENYKPESRKENQSHRHEQK